MMHDSTTSSLLTPKKFEGNNSGDGRSLKSTNHMQWRRVLYDTQRFPDNYVDADKFLEDLRTSVPPNPIPFGTLCIGATVIVQQVTVITIFLTLYKYIMIQAISVTGIVLFNIAALIIGYIIHIIFSETGQSTNIIRTIQSSTVSAICLRVAAPMLQTLTSSFSDDTIHALVILFSAVHLVFYDYLFVTCESDIFAGTLSLNAGLLTALLLASRLYQIEMVFGFIALAIICFALFPQTARLIKKKSLVSHIAGVLVQWSFASIILFQLDKTLFVAYQSLVAFLLLICPFWLIKMQSYKRSLKGPWDIATLASTEK